MFRKIVRVLNQSGLKSVKYKEDYPRYISAENSDNINSITLIIKLLNFDDLIEIKLNPLQAFAEDFNEIEELKITGNSNNYQVLLGV